MKGLGWLQDAPDARDHSFGVHVGGTAPSGPLSLLPYRARRLEQDGVSACVAFALTRAIHVCLLAAGHVDAPEPSPLYLYANARFAENAGDDPAKAQPIDDRGSYPRLAMQATRALGFCAERDWPFEPTLRNTRPKLRCYRRAYDQRNLQFYRIDSSGEERINDLRVALSKNYPVIFGMPVDRAFLDHHGSDPIDVIWIEEIVGGHMMCALGHDGAGQVLFDNWWGNDWGFGDGFGHMTDDLFGSALLGDIYAIQAAPVFV